MKLRTKLQKRPKFATFVFHLQILDPDLVAVVTAVAAAAVVVVLLLLSQLPPFRLLRPTSDFPTEIRIPSPESEPRRHQLSHLPLHSSNPNFRFRQDLRIGESAVSSA